jgi:hypothetical protein
MANCSIPSSTPAIGRISTPSSRRSRRQNDREANCGSRVANCRLESGVKPPHSKARSARKMPAPFHRFAVSPFHSSAALQSALRAQSVRRWGLCCSWRVKGAWWPSRSSKPSSPRKWRGRFDSYPLRLFFVTSVAVSLRETRVAHRATATPAIERR